VEATNPFFFSVLEFCWDSFPTQNIMISTGTAVAEIAAESFQKSELRKFSETKDREANRLR